MIVWSTSTDEGGMLIYGTKVKYKRLGYAADFCPLCGEIRQFAIERMNAAPHLYYVALGEGKLVEHRRVCLHCHTQYLADVHDYRTLASAPAPVAALVPDTFHNIEQARRAELSLPAGALQSA
jgi:ribosomal protein S27AE